MKQATENKRQFDEEVDIHSDGLYVDRDGDFDGDVGDVYVDVDEKILFQTNHLQSFRVKILGS